MPHTPTFFELDAQHNRIVCKNAWDLKHLAQLKTAIAHIKLSAGKSILVDGSNISKMDSAGAWVLNTWLQKLSSDKREVKLENFSEQQEKLLELTQETETKKHAPKVKIPNWLARIGKYSYNQYQEYLRFLAFIGKLTLQGLKILRNPANYRWNAIADTIDHAGYQALPIIAILSFAIGIVISYQMGNQLREYGANVFIVNLLGLSVLREFGPLITAIMVAGRTGSAFTAQLGIMKINQEIDALNTMGVLPAEILLLPRLIGLVIVMPLLTMWADLFGIFGGMVMANNMLDITWAEFLRRFQQEIPLRSLIIGLGKAPLFALIIASVSCFQGMIVSGSAESVGQRTTRSVVLTIFFIIITDGLLSILFSEFEL